MKKEIYYTTSNPGKFEEVKGFIEKNEPNIEIKRFEADIPEIQTLDQKMIAVDKAIKAWELLQKPLLVDDSAIYFEKYNKFPGTLSKYVSLGIGIEGIKNLFEVGDKATFLVYLSYIEGPNSLKVFEGRCEGHLVKQKNFTANPNLPYDAIFVPEGIEKTYAQIRNTAEGEKYLYRTRAVKNFLEWYSKQKEKPLK